MSITSSTKQCGMYTARAFASPSGTDLPDEWRIIVSIERASIGSITSYSIEGYDEQSARAGCDAVAAAAALDYASWEQRDPKIAARYAEMRRRSIDEARNR